MTNVEPNFYKDVEVINHPADYFDLMRSRGPVVREQYHQTVMVTGYDAALEILSSNSDNYSSAVSIVGPIPPLPFTPSGDDIGDQLDAHRGHLPWADHLACFDGKKHSDHRSILMRLLTPQRVKDNEEYLRGLADTMLDKLLVNDVCNIVPEFAHAVTTYAVSDILGIPVEDRAELLALIGAPPSQVDGDAPAKIGPDPLQFLKPRFQKYLQERIDQPSGDLMSELVKSRLPGDIQPDMEKLVQLACFLFGAGQDTTSRLIAMAIKVMAEDQDLQDRLRADPGLLPAFIEEVLRYDGPVKVSYRLVRRTTSVAGVELQAGTIVAVSLAGGNHDPAQFEDPHTINIDRTNLRNHLSFGKGKHACLGAPLGRLESRVALEKLLARTSRITLSEEHHGSEGARHFRYEPTYTFRSLADLYVRFESA